MVSSRPSVTGAHDVPDGNPEPEQSLATGYETSDDFLEYTFTLQEGVQYHNDGGELTASDVAYSWERLASSDASERAYFIPDSLGIAAENQEGGEYSEGTRTPPGRCRSRPSATTRSRSPYDARSTRRCRCSPTELRYPPGGSWATSRGYDGEIDQETLATSESLRDRSVRARLLAAG